MNELAGRKVLVVEDAFYLAMDVKAALQGVGAEVIGPFAEVEDALASLERRPPHCAVLDVNLGVGASFDLARALKRRAVPFLFFTGYDQSAIPAEFADVLRLEKPVDSARVVSALENCCCNPLTIT